MQDHCVELVLDRLHHWASLDAHGSSGNHSVDSASGGLVNLRIDVGEVDADGRAVLHLLLVVELGTVGEAHDVRQDVVRRLPLAVQRGDQAGLVRVSVAVDAVNDYWESDLHVIAPCCEREG